MKSVLISDFEIIKSDNWIDSNNYDINELLIHIATIECDYIIIYAETLTKKGNRKDFSGIELIKHIRLTAEYNNINKKSILLLHWMPVEYYIDNNVENIFLFSPGIYRKRLPMDYINTTEFKDLEDDCNLNEFIFSSEKDEIISKHVFRNKIAINEFKQQIDTNNNLVIKPLWFKKLYYKEGYFNKSINTYNNIFNGELRILLIDDLANEWAEAIKNIAPNVHIECLTNYSESEKRVYDIKNIYLKMTKEFIDCIEIITENRNQSYRLEEDKKNLIYQLNSINKKIENNESVITENQKNLEKKIIEFKSFIKTQEKLSESILLYTEHITDNTFSSHYNDIIKLNKLFNEIIQLKNSINSLNIIIETEQQEKIKQSKQIQSNEERLNILMLENKKCNLKLPLLIEIISNKEYDIILLDMHLTANSENNLIIDTDGYKLLLKLNESELNISTVMFSATKKNIDNLFYKQEFPFLIKNKYIKGITPVSDFVEILKNINVRSQIYRLQNYLKLVISIPTYQRRIYESYDSPVYENKEMSPQGKKDAESQLNKVIYYLSSYIHSSNVIDLESIIEPLADIIRVNFFQEERSLKDRNRVSLFKEENLRTNKIPSKFSDINKLRNWKKYYITNPAEIQKKYDDFTKNLNLSIIEQLIKTTTNLIIFNQ